MEPSQEAHLDRSNGLINFDSTLETYIKENIAFDFKDKERVIKVNVLSAKPERWTEQKEKTLTKVLIDGNHVNLPLVSFYKNDIVINKTMVPYWLGDDKINYEIGRIFKPTTGEQVESVTVLERRGMHIQAFYTIEIVAYSTAHLYHLVEQFIMNEGLYWNDRTRKFSLRATYDSIPDTSQSADLNQERIKSVSFNLTLSGQILPKFRKSKELANPVVPNTSKVIITEKIIDL